MIADLDYNDSAYIDKFNAGLPKRTQTQLALLPTKPETIVEYANKAIKIDNKRYNIRARHTKGHPQAGPTSILPHNDRAKEPTLTDPEPMDLEATRRCRVAAQPQKPTNHECYNGGRKGHCFWD